MLGHVMDQEKRPATKREPSHLRYCPACEKEQLVHKDGLFRSKQRYICKVCRYRFIDRSEREYVKLDSTVLDKIRGLLNEDPYISQKEIHNKLGLSEWMVARAIGIIFREGINE
jgi:transposase-like protein